MEVVSFISRPTLSPGGKTRAIYSRLSNLSGFDGVFPVIMTPAHDIGARINFARLCAESGLKNVQMLSFFEAAYRHRSVEVPREEEIIPDWDSREDVRGESFYRFKGRLVMVERRGNAPGFSWLRRKLRRGDGAELVLEYVDNRLLRKIEKRGDSKTTIYCVDGHAVAKEVTVGKEFGGGYNCLDGKRYHHVTRLHSSLVSAGISEEALVFIDGITFAYLSKNMPADKILFLHADHNCPDGSENPQSRYLIENFDGVVIATATQRQKTRILADLNPRVPIAVVPHFIDIPEDHSTKRAHLCTVSRLELEGKPIHECIEAFSQIMDSIPGVDYHIYGSGKGHADLASLIAKLRCQDRVFLKGYTSNPHKVFSHSIACLAPTMAEGFGLSILEALACECPVVSYDVDYGPREMIQAGRNGILVKPGDIDGISSAILDIIENAEIYRTSCRDSIRKYSHSAYVDTYRTLVRSRGAVATDADRILVPRLDIQDADAARAYKAEVDAKWDIATTSANAMLAYISVAKAEGAYLDCIRAGEALAALRPNKVGPLVRLAWFSRHLGDSERAATYLRRLREMDEAAFQKILTESSWLRDSLAQAPEAH